MSNPRTRKVSEAMPKAKELLVYGTGGHAKVVCDCAIQAGFRIIGLLDDDPAKHDTSLWEFPVLGGFERIQKGFPTEVKLVLAIGDNEARRRLAERLQPLGVEFAVVVHPSVQLGRGVELGEGTVVFAGAVINADTALGRHVIVNTGATIDHDCVIGDFAHLAPGSHLAGGVHVGPGTLVGIGACAVPNVKIGAHTIVGAGAVVVRDLPDRVTAVGIPARVITT